MPGVFIMILYFMIFKFCIVILIFDFCILNFYKIHSALGTHSRFVPPYFRMHRTSVNTPFLGRLSFLMFIMIVFATMHNMTSYLALSIIFRMI